MMESEGREDLRTENLHLGTVKLVNSLHEHGKPGLVVPDLVLLFLVLNSGEGC